MILTCKNHPYVHDMQNLCAVFFPFEKICEQTADGEAAPIAVETAKKDETLFVSATVNGKHLQKTHAVAQGEDEATQMSVLLFSVLRDLTGYTPPWGILYGVRPAKLMHRLCTDLGEAGAKRYFQETLLVSERKTALTLEVMKRENRSIALSAPQSFSLYVSIPFCPTRCTYCSFVSHSVERTKRLVAPYVELLCRELEELGALVKTLGLRLETVYFGGGTPTALSAPQLALLLETIAKSFDLSTLREYTVEAGRPDTVTAEKLHTLKQFGVGRISINPQTFNDRVLTAIGRKHTAQQTLDAYALATDCGFDNINMDLIAGLPLDTTASFRHSVDTAISCGAKSITVHTLAMKTASYMSMAGDAPGEAQRTATADMVDYSAQALSAAGYAPYYMYRQSKSLGNLENVGWCRPGADCLYNVFMMDETHSVLAAGAGAVTRLKNQNTGFIDRIYNYKYPYEYIDRFDEVLRRKSGIIRFYDEY